MTEKKTTGSKRGFAAMHPDKVREMARQGGKAAHAKGAAHQFTSEEAIVAGRKGGIKSHANRRAKIDGTTAPAGEKVVDVACSSAAGCSGTVKAGTPEAAEAIGKPYTKGAKAPTGDEQAAKDGASADEDPGAMNASCGTGGCGSSGKPNPC
jgi:general stress protein YciG